MRLPSASKLIELPALQVARIGYRALMRGERVAIAGAGNRIAVALMRFVPGALLIAAVDRRADGGR